MAWYDRFRRPKEPTLENVLEKYALVDVNEGAVLVAERPNGKVELAETPAQRDLRELGSSATLWGHIANRDYNPELTGYLAYSNYERMRKGDSQVRSALRIIKTPVLAARWFIEPVSESAEDRQIADFVWWNLTQGMTASWPILLTEILAFLDFGWYAFEKVYTPARETPFGTRITWQKFAPRPPQDLHEWDWDRTGGPNGAWFWHPTRAGGRVRIPISKLVIFTFDKEAGNMEGVSVLRSAYKHWFFKESLYKIDAIQKERHGIGIPIIKLPPNFNDNDKRLADEMGRNLRTNEKAHVVLPPNWDLMFARLEGQPVDALASAEHHGRMIFENVLAQFMVTGEGDSETQEQMFQKGTRFIAEIVRDAFNRWAIPQLVRFNWDTDRYPELRVRRIGDTTDWRTISFAVRNFVGSGILRPDDKLEAWVREEMDLPKADIETLRQIAAPQAPRVGLPRQSTTPGMRQAQRPEAEGRREDRSGG